ncbi:MAG TPA: beta-N-acetylhexosaminidase [Candidatus Omnitrophota bacterium]|nr:beta-N-acetylhexosaminidase [Candidatus Omnitrophota bacterium]
MRLKEMVGQKLMIGVSGAEMTDGMAEIFRETHAGGVIFFRPNFSDAKGFKKLIADLESTLGRKLIVAVDHEGGRVIHLTEGVTVFPDNLALGKTRDESFAERQGAIEALELRRLGIDLNLAPTLDVLTENFSPNIGIRSYGGNPDWVSKLGAARIKAMQAGGLSACAKHFPGQGQSPLDAHLKLPVLPTTWDEMKRVHIKPFVEAIRAGVDTVMSSHPVYPNLDPSPRTPATFSRKLVREYLREELGFRGLILSDDLEMGALSEIASIGESACRAAEAGHDFILVCHKAEAQREAYHALLDAYRSKRLNSVELEESVARIQAFAKKRPERFSGGTLCPESAGSGLASEIARKAVKVFKNHKMLPLRIYRSGGRTLSVIFPKLSSLSRQVLIEEECLDERSFIRKTFSSAGVVPKAIEIIPFDPSDGEIKETSEKVQASDLVVFFCYDAHLYPQTKKLLDEIQSTMERCVIVLLRDPYDDEFVKPEAACVTAFGFRKAQIEAAVEALFSENS